MSDYERCPTCRQFGGMNSHKCPSMWEARIPDSDGGSDDWWTPVRGSDGQEVAAKFAEDYDCEGDYTMIRSGRGQVLVRADPDAEPVLFDIEAESIPTYHAWEATPETPATGAKPDAAASLEGEPQPLPDTPSQPSGEGGSLT